MLVVANDIDILLIDRSSESCRFLTQKVMLTLSLILSMVANWKSYPHDATEKDLKRNENENLE